MLKSYNYNSDAYSVSEYNQISFSIHTDKVFEKLDEVTIIKHTMNIGEEIIYLCSGVIVNEELTLEASNKMGFFNIIVAFNKWEKKTVRIQDMANYKKYQFNLHEFLEHDDLGSILEKVIRGEIPENQLGRY